jgi:hypothetical protein
MNWTFSPGNTSNWVTNAIVATSSQPVTPTDPSARH